MELIGYSFLISYFSLTVLAPYKKSYLTTHAVRTKELSADGEEGVAALAKREKLCVGVFGGRLFVCRRRGGVSGAGDGGNGAADGAHPHILLADPAGGHFNGGAGV